MADLTSILARVKLPDLLATPRGRLLAFFLLYVAEGIPSGFTGTAIATQMRRQGLDPAAIGAFVGALYLPWGIKWAYGPFVDVLSSDRWGRRRAWIIGTQALMVATLLIASPLDFRSQLGLFTSLMFLNNLFAATQDVAIDALAVNVLRADQAGIANGLMFGGSYLGIGIGGAGVLFLTSVIGFQATFWIVALVISLITLVVAVPMVEPKSSPRLRGPGSPLAAIARELGAFARDAGRAFISSRAAFFAIFVAALPMGAYALSLSLQSNLAVELGLDDRAIGVLTLVCTVVTASLCVVGGWVSDRFGRRRSLAIFIAGTTLPTIALAVAMHQHHWILPVAPDLPDRPIPSRELVRFFFAAVVVYSVFQGLYYGVGTAIFMDVTTPAVAGTQFTAYMALCNLTTSYSSTWQGAALTRWGYPTTLGVDCLVGLIGLLFLPMMGKVLRGNEPEAAGQVGQNRSVGEGG
ncbi:MAG: MFS transporter [Candidatus Eisenbacteria bacterium]|nr:MFS transporter [Candidatus Eisenbacteria bacterium]